MEILLLQQGIILLASAIAAFTDWQKGFIYDWNTYPLIGIGLLLQLWQQNWTGIGLGIAVFLALYVFYWLGKLGGGDVKLFTGIALVLPFHQNQFFLLPVLFFAGLGAITFYSIYYLFRLKKDKATIDWKQNRNALVKGLLFAILFSLYFFLLARYNGTSETVAVLLGIPFLLASVFVALEHEIKKRYFISRVKLSELTEEEAIAPEEMEPEILEKSGLGTKGIVGEKEKQKLLELGITEIPIYQHAPKLGPFILVGIVLAIFFPYAIKLFFLGI